MAARQIGKRAASITTVLFLPSFLDKIGYNKLAHKLPIAIADNRPPAMP